MSSDKPPPPSSQSSGSSGVRAALRYTGLPVWLAKRPKLPSRNWLIFIGVTSSLLGLYTYDRRKCKEIRDEYIKRVAHLAQEPMGSMDLPRKVTVYASKWPGDEDANRSLKYFRKYVKVRTFTEHLLIPFCLLLDHSLSLLLQRLTMM